MFSVWFFSLIYVYIYYVCGFNFIGFIVIDYYFNIFLCVSKYDGYVKKVFLVFFVGFNINR